MKLKGVTIKIMDLSKRNEKETVPSAALLERIKRTEGCPAVKEIIGMRLLKNGD